MKRKDSVEIKGISCKKEVKCVRLNTIVQFVGVYQMTIKEFLRIAIFNPTQLWKIIVKPMKSSKRVFFLLTLLLMLPGMIQMTGLFHSLGQDLVEISQQLPEFEVKNQQLITQEKNKGFVYKTDSVIFVFDESGKTTSEDLLNETSSTIPVFALLKDGFYLETSINHQKIELSQLENMNKSFFKDIAATFQQTIWLSLLIVFVMYFLFNTVYLFIILWIVSFIVKVIAVLFMKVFIRFPKPIGWQVVLGAAVLPVLIYTMIDLLGIRFIGPGEFIFLATSFNWVLGIREFLKNNRPL